MSEDKSLSKEEMLAVEETALRDISGVLEAMDTIVKYEPFKVMRNGKQLFSFRVRGLDDGETENCRTEATKFVKSKRLGGVTMPADFNTAKYNSLLIVQATHPEDKEFLWGNKELQKKAKVLAPWQVVDKVLLSGEKGRVIELIEQLSGEEGTVEAIKNS